MDYFILGLWGVITIISVITMIKLIKLFNFLKEINKDYYKKIKDLTNNCYNNKVNIENLGINLNENTNSILDEIAELTGNINITGNKVCKILDIVDAKDKVFIKSTDTLRSEQSIKTRKAKNSLHGKKVTTIHCNKNIAK